MNTFIEPRQKPLDVVVHPIVLLSVVDHYNRVAKGTSKRVVGTLLGDVLGFCNVGDLIGGGTGGITIIVSLLFSVNFAKKKPPQCFRWVTKLRKLPTERGRQ